jgi:hypothetical protein
MTNSYSLSLRPKIVIIHGMNNNCEIFEPIADEFRQRGFDTQFIVLPGHLDKKLQLSGDEALKLFVDVFNAKIQSPYTVIAYSQGALYFELTLNSGLIPKPLKAIYLAPAFFVRNERFIKFLLRHMLIHEYATLMDKIRKLAEHKIDSSVPRLILVDPKDELVDPRKIKARYPNETILFPRRLKLRFRHHVIFNPKYLSKAEWEGMMKTIFEFLSNF